MSVPLETPQRVPPQPPAHPAWALVFPASAVAFTLWLAASQRPVPLRAFLASVVVQCNPVLLLSAIGLTCGFLVFSLMRSGHHRHRAAYVDYLTRRPEEQGAVRTWPMRINDNLLLAGVLLPYAFTVDGAGIALCTLSFYAASLPLHVSDAALRWDAWHLWRDEQCRLAMEARQRREGRRGRGHIVCETPPAAEDAEEPVHSGRDVGGR